MAGALGHLNVNDRSLGGIDDAVNSRTFRKWLPSSDRHVRRPSRQWRARRRDPSFIHPPVTPWHEGTDRDHDLVARQTIPLLA